MTESLASVTVPPLEGLRLEDALRLLRQAGREALPGLPGSPGWLQALIDALCELSSRDPLTGLANRRHLESVLQRELDRVRRAGAPALLLVLDIDHFKRINDGWGHGAGDAVIRAVAQALQDSVRPMDTVARIGGEEFALVLPQCAPAFAPAVAERLRLRVAQCEVALAPEVRLRVTASLGGAFAPDEAPCSAAQWIERADALLYRAKALGRNCSCLEASWDAGVSTQEKRFLLACRPTTEKR